MAVQNFNFEALSEFDRHRMVMFIHDAGRRFRGFIAIHRGGTQPSFGATRLWRYETPIHALKDALRLSRMMSYKSAMAGLPYGGAKGVIMDDARNLKERRLVLEEYARRVEALHGSFVTGTDAGLYTRDLVLMRRITSSIVGLRANPTVATAAGLVEAFAVCLKNVYGVSSFSGRTIAVQGLGKIGMELIRTLYSRVSRIVACDIDAHKVRAAGRRFPKISFVAPRDIYRQKADVFSPCALGGTLTVEIAKKLRCAIVAGGANNQLENDEAGDALWRSGILYAPDYVVNVGGLMSVVDEFEYKKTDAERLRLRLAGIPEMLRTILYAAQRSHTAPHRIGNAMAEKRIKIWK